MMIRTVREQHLTNRGTWRERRAQCAPACACVGGRGGQSRPELVAIRREMIEQHRASIGGAPARDIARWMTRPTVASPEYHDWHTKSGCNRGQHRGMPKGIRRIEHLRSPGPERLEHRAASQQIAHERLAGWDQLIREHVPRAG